MEITVLCKVVDNFGDIGVCWRLARKLKRIAPSNEINLIVDDLDSFSKICGTVNPAVSLQVIDDIKIYGSKSDEFCYKEFSGEKNVRLQVILECFQCGRPDWLEKILFDDELNHTVQIIMIDYLSAEDYAESFHKLQSLTRRGKVKKVNFMPGFTSKTGGLTIDENWNSLLPRNSSGPVLFFSYGRNWQPVIKGIERGMKAVCGSNKIMVAQGIGKASFIKSWKKTDCHTMELTELDYLNQNDWDEMMKNCSFLFIRGEESLSRACLSGIPFVWHAYPQSDEYQLVKVNALLGRMESFFTKSQFELIKKVWLIFNSPESEYSDEQTEQAVFELVSAQNELEEGFGKFAANLRKNGDLAANLMTFIEEICII